MVKIGILNRATKASTQSKVGSIRDAIGLAVDECQTEMMEQYYDNGASVSGKEYLSQKKIADALKKQGYTLYGSSDGGPATGKTSLKEIKDELSTGKAKINGTFYVGASINECLEVHFSKGTSSTSEEDFAITVHYGTGADATKDGTSELAKITLAS